MELDHPDKFLAHYYFLGYDPRATDYGDLQGANLWRVEQGRLVPYPVFYLYRAMRDLRGTRLYAESSRPDMRVRAALNGNKLSVLVFNDARQVGYRRGGPGPAGRDRAPAGCQQRLESGQ